MPARPTSFEAWASELATLLRDREVAVPVGALITFVAALGEVGALGRATVHDAGLATLLRSPDDRPAFDQAFAQWWDGTPGAPPAGDDATPEVELAFDQDEGNGTADDEAGDDPSEALRFSAAERLRHVDLAQCSPSELDELHRLISLIALRPVERRTRRRRPAQRSGDRIDLRRTLRATVASDGDVLAWHRSRPRRRPRKVVLLIDVSGSMEPYSRGLLRFAHAAVSGSGRTGVKVEAFAVGTRLTRLTQELSEPNPDAALGLATDATRDFSGGTRLGDTLAQFVSDWGAPGVARGAEVVVLSDGWDRGDAALLDDTMARLALLARRVIWVNPLRASPGYAPLARGMATALPHVDEFVDGHSFGSLENLAELLGQRRFGVY